jgi:hypothetical protein
MLTVQATVELEDTFNKVLAKIDQQVHRGLGYMGQEMVTTAVESMPYKEGPAPKGKPPHSHTGTLASAVAWAREKDRIVFGTMFSVVGLRGAWLEFGGRPLDEGQKGKPRKRKLLPHPFIRPARDINLDKFAPAVAGSFVVSQ